MTVNRAWVERNVGFDPIKLPAPTTTVASGAIVCWALIAGL